MTWVPIAVALLFAGVALLFVLTGMMQSWNLSLNILNLALLSWHHGDRGEYPVGLCGPSLDRDRCVGRAGGAGGGAGLGQAGARGLGLLGGPRIFGALLFAAVAIAFAVWLYRRLKPGTSRSLALALYLVVLFFIYRAILDPAVLAVEANNPAQAGTSAGWA